MVKKIGKHLAGRIETPKGKSVAVCLGWDFDAQSTWIGGFKLKTPCHMSQGAFGAEVGVPRVLDLFEKYNIKATFFIPGHTIDTFPEICKEIVAKGHEVGHHGYIHATPAELKYEEEVKEMKMGLESLNRIGVKPSGYRAPNWDFSKNTLKILEEYGFIYDSSLMENDLYPYHPRPVQIHADKGNIFGPSSKIIEIPASWYLEDWLPNQFVWGDNEGLRPVEETYQRWISIFDFAVNNCPGSVFALTNHPQVSGRAHLIQMYERLLQHMLKSNAWFVTYGEAANAFVLH